MTFLNARLRLAAALHNAAARGELTDEPTAILAALGPAIAEIEDAAAHLADERSHAQRAHRLAADEWEAERRMLARMLARAERDATAMQSTVQEGPLGDPHGCYLYYLWDYQHQLLYVGMSTNVLRRLGQHVDNPDRTLQISHITTQECEDEDAMRRLESAAIRTQRPPWNVIGVG